MDRNAAEIIPDLSKIGPNRIRIKTIIDHQGDICESMALALRSHLNPEWAAWLQNLCFYRTVPEASGILKKAIDHWP